MGYSKDFNSMETTKKGIQGEEAIEKFLVNQKSFDIISHPGEYHFVDYHLKHDGNVVAVADSKNKDYMFKRPAQGYNLSHIVSYISEASRLRVPALIICQDSALKRVYSIELFNALKRHGNRMLIRMGKDIHTKVNILQVEIPLELHGKIADLSQISADIQHVDLSRYDEGNKPGDILPMFQCSSTSAMLTATKEGVPYPYCVEDGTQSLIGIPGRVIEPLEVIEMLPKAHYGSVALQQEFQGLLSEAKKRYN